MKVTFARKCRIRISVLLIIPCLPLLLPSIGIAGWEDGFFKSISWFLKDMVSDFINPRW